MRSPIAVRAALAVTLVAGTLLGVSSVGSDAAAPTPARAPQTAPVVANARLLSLRLTPGGRVTVVSDTAVSAGAVPPSQTTAAAARAKAKAPDGGDVGAAVVTLLRADGTVAYRHAVALTSTIRNEFPASPGLAGKAPITGTQITDAAPVVTLLAPDADVAAVRVDTATATYRTPAGSAALSRARTTSAEQQASQAHVVDIPGYPTGPVGNRLDLVVLGDGYTADQESDFVTDARNTISSILSIDPYQAYRDYFNVIGVFAPSPESGADHPAYSGSCTNYDPAPSCCPDSVGSATTSTFVNTRYDSTFCAYGVERLVVPIDTDQVYADVDAAYPNWDQLLVIVNDPEYGGAGGAIASTSTNSSGTLVVQHELGHSIMRLDDEYSDATPGYPGCSDHGRNGIKRKCLADVTDQTDTAKVKWRRWFSDPGAVPTTGPQNPSVVGLFVGAHYSPDTYYRSCWNCIMRSLGQPFGAVAAEQLPLVLYHGGWQGPTTKGDGGIDVLEPGSVKPTPSHYVTLARGAARTFSATVLAPGTTATETVTWSVDGHPVATSAAASGDTVSYTYTRTGSGRHRVSLRVVEQPGILNAASVGKSASSRSWQVGPKRHARDVLVNGGFEQKLRKGWKRSGIGPRAISCKKHVAGRCALVVRPARHHAAVLTQTVKPGSFLAGDKVRLTGSLDAVALRRGATLTVTIKTAGGAHRTLALRWFQADRGDHQGYRRRSASRALPGDATSVKVVLRVNPGSGRAAIDALSLVDDPA